MVDQPRTTPADEVLRSADAVRVQTKRIMSETQIFDMHTHLFPPAFGDLARWGIDHLLTYHYLVAEVMRAETAYNTVVIKRLGYKPE